MAKYTKIPEDTFDKLQLNAGVLVSDFDVETGAVSASDIIGATSGGISFSAVPSFSDEGDDIDNCPKNTKELKKLEDWEIGLSGTFVSLDARSVKRLIAAGEVDEDKITPRNYLEEEDFEDIWWVGDYSSNNSEESGGFIAIHMMNALSTGGFSIQSTDRAKGAFSFDFTAHYSIDNPDVVPFEVFVKGA